MPGEPLGGGTPRPSKGGTGAVDFPCAQVWAGTGPSANPSRTPECCPLARPRPAKDCPISSPFATTKDGRGEVGLVLPPHPPASVSREPLGGARAELEAPTRAHLRPVACAAGGGGGQGPRWGGQRTHRAGPNPRPSSGQETSPGALPSGSTHKCPSWAVAGPAATSSPRCPHTVRTSAGCCQPCRLLLSRCLHRRWDVLFIALTLYFEVCPFQAEKPLRDTEASLVSVLQRGGSPDQGPSPLNGRGVPAGRERRNREG